MTELLPTAVPGLDTLLGGGLSPNALVLIVGSPGAGKTILASQLLFQAARGGARGLIITNFSEGAVKLLEHLRTLDFFDETLVTQQLTILPFTALLGDTPEAVAGTVVNTIRKLGVQWLFVDGFQSAGALLGDDTAIRRFLGTLANLISYLDVTCLVTLEGSGRDPQMAPALTAADVLLGLDYRVKGWEHLRRMEIVKNRGTAHLGGLHAYTITGAGVTVIPRLEALPPPAARQWPAGRAGFGLPELDALLGGGVTRGTATVLAGAPGTGKTSLALHWAITDASPEQPTIFVSFDDQPGVLQRKAQLFRLDLDAAVASGAVVLLNVAPFEIDPDAVALRVLAAVTTSGQQVVFDGVGNLLRKLGTRGYDYLAALVARLASTGATSLYTIAIEPGTSFRIDARYTAIQSVAENIIVVQHVLAIGRMHYVLAVLKTSFSPYDPALRELLLTEEGIRVLEPQETAPGVLRAIAASTGSVLPSDAPS